jgi:uncharacterized protein (DUF2062 family)
LFFEGVLYFKEKIAGRLIDAGRCYCKKVASLSGCPRKIAAGVALGVAMDFLPIPIISIPISYLVARLIRVNPVAAVATVVFLKLAVPFFYTLNILTGNLIAGGLAGPEITLNASFPGASLVEKLVEHGFPFLVGSAVNATVAGIIVYALLIFFLKKRRMWHNA